MSISGFIARLVIGVMLGILLVILSGGGILWVLLFFFTPVGLGCAVVLAPIEMLANRLKHRWIGLLAIPPAGAAIPWIVSLVDDNPNFQAGIGQLSVMGAAMGVFWVLSSLITLLFTAPPVVDERLIG